MHISLSIYIYIFYSAYRFHPGAHRKTGRNARQFSNSQGAIIFEIYYYYYFLCNLLFFHSKTFVLGALGGHFGTLGVHFGGLGLPRGLQGGPCRVRGRFFMDFGCPQGPCWGSLWDNFCTFSSFLVTKLEVGLRTCFLCGLGWEKLPIRRGRMLQKHSKYNGF